MHPCPGRSGRGRMRQRTCGAKKTSSRRIPMNLLVTAGNTQVPIDRVRCLTNIFTGRTGAAIALHAHARGHAVTLLTSHPDTVNDLAGGRPEPAERWRLYPYHTFDDLNRLMAQ